MTFFNPYAEFEITEANLPHWRQGGVIYFVTFRLADSLPSAVWRKWADEREEWVSKHPQPWEDDTSEEYHALFSARIQEYLDAREGSCVLAIRQAQRLVMDALGFFNGSRYELGEHVVASNHVHVLLGPHPGEELREILHSWKSFTAKEINKIQAASKRLDAFCSDRELVGRVWQKESYDHIVRSERALWRIEQYIRSHPEYEERK